MSTIDTIMMIVEPGYRAPQASEPVDGRAPPTPVDPRRNRPQRHTKTRVTARHVDAIHALLTRMGPSTPFELTMRYGHVGIASVRLAMRLLEQSRRAEMTTNGRPGCGQAIVWRAL